MTEEALAHNDWTTKMIADRSAARVGMPKRRERKKGKYIFL